MKKTFLFTLIVLVNQTLFGQQDITLKDIVPPSPEASAFAKYGTYPCGTYTGRPDISVPIYEIKDGALSVPISLSYDATGIRVNDMSSWVGTNWSLNAGGLVSQMIVGQSDINTSTGRDAVPPRASEIVNNSDYFNYLQALVDGDVMAPANPDAGPDKFFYSFNGRSGSFVLDRNRNVMQIPKTSLKISIIGLMQGFVITDETGTAYIFNYLEKTESYTYSASGSSPVLSTNGSTYKNQTTGYYLTEIASADRIQHIYFTYENEVTGAKDDTYSETQGPKFQNGNQSPTQNYHGYRWSGTNRVITSPRLKTITFSNGKVEFTRVAGRQDDAGSSSRLDEITVYNKNAIDGYIKLRSFKFVQGYYYSSQSYAQYSALPNQTVDRYRLRLDTLKLKDSSGIEISRYTFSYNSGLLPPKTSCSQDWWGYYNGKPNSTLVPTTSIPDGNGGTMTIGDADRNSDETSMKSGILEKIKYPTGGYTIFETESHKIVIDYSDVSASPSVNAQGMSTNNLVVQTFVAPPLIEAGSGRLTINIGPYSATDPQPFVKIKNLSTGAQQIFTSTDMTTFYSSILPYDFVSGTTYELTASCYVNQSYGFANFIAGYTYSQYNPHTSPIGGLRIKSIKNYNADNTLANQESYTYGPNENGGGVFIGISGNAYTYGRGQRVYWADNGSGCAQSGGVGGYVYGVYLGGSLFDQALIQGSPVVYTDVVKYYGSATVNSGKTAYNYGTDFQQQVETSPLPSGNELANNQGILIINNTWKKGQLLKQQEYKFNNDNTYSLVQENQNTYNILYTDTTYGLIAQTKFDRVSTNSTTCVFRYFEDYAWADYPVYSGFVQLIQTLKNDYSSNGTGVVQTIVNHTYDNTYKDIEIKSNTLNSKGETLEMEKKYPFHKAQLITSITPAESSALDSMVSKNILSPIEEINRNNNIQRLLKKTSYEYVNAATIAPVNIKYQIGSNAIEPRLLFPKYDVFGNLLEQQKFNDLKLSYIWDYQNRYPIAEVSNASQSNIAFTSFEADGSGNWNLSTGGGNTSQVSANVNAAGSNYNLFPTQVTTNLTSNDHNTPAGMELGIKFTSATAGTINGIRFYKTSGNTGTHIGELSSSTGVRLAQATFTGETATGWQTVLFSSPVSITANTTYTAAYYSSLGNYVENVFYFINNSVSSGPLNASADGTSGMVGTDPGNGQGVYLSNVSAAAFPNKLYQAANYWVDVVFSPSTTPYANAGANQTITLPVSSVVLNGSGSTGSISSYSWIKISGPNNPSIASSTSAFTSVSGLIQGVYFFQLSLNSGASNSQVTVTVQASGTPINIFTTQAVPTVTLNDGSALEVGAKFRSSVSGQITGIRFYKTSGNTGTHIGELYAYPSGTRLAQATFSGETASGWQTVTFSSPVTITPNTTYIAAYWSSSGNYSANSNHYALPVTNGPLTGLADGTDGHNGIYSYTGSPAFPTTYTVMADHPNYWVDILFLPDNTPIPNAGSNLSVTLPVSSITLNGSNSGGTLSNYQWTKVSGPNNPTIVSPNSLITNVTGLIAGTYVFQLAINGASNSAFALTGTKSYNLTGNTIIKSGLTSGKKYILSYWTRGSACNVSGASSVTSTGRSTNGWTYFEHLLTMTTTTLTVTGSNYIDELRLYPQGAQMTSLTYSPLIGMTTKNDPNSEITYFEYDGFQRLKNIRDYQGNIIKNFQYNYAQSCTSCIVSMKTFNSTPTISYPVGVFSYANKLLGNAATQSQYVTLWNSDTNNQSIGTLAAGSDSMHFILTVNNGQTSPGFVIGCRYYQYDLNYNQIDGILKRNCEYIDFGDGIGMFLGKTTTDITNIVLPLNTVASNPGNLLSSYYIHTYTDASLKTLTFYHNDGNECMAIDNQYSPALSLTHLSNLRGYCPQNSQMLGASSYQQLSALSVASIINWNSINSVTLFTLNTGDGGINPCTNIGYVQDFMQNNVGLNYIKTALHPDYISYFDPTFKLSKLKSNWNTYFTNLQNLWICDEHWNREDLTALNKLNTFVLINGNQNHSNNLSGNPPTPIPSPVLDNILIQIAAGAGQNVSNGVIYIQTGGSVKTSLSDPALNYLKSKGWGIYFNDVKY